jgi:ribosomal protein S18 acetylase RimI-like enzyme
MSDPVLQNAKGTIEFKIISTWSPADIVELYRAGGWWEMGWNPGGITPLIRGSYLFIIAADKATGTAVGMGRIIADGCSDGYLQDIVVLPDYRNQGIGGKIIRLLKTFAELGGLSWIGLIAEPGKESLYERSGFRSMEKYTPMLLEQDRTRRYHDTQ